jgi:GWxTD domain-containing protein
MKRFFILVILTVMVHSIFGQKLNALLTYRSFCDEELYPYIEFTFFFDGKSLVYAKNENNKYQAEIRITVEIKNQTATELYQKLDYVLTSDEIDNLSETNRPSVYDIQNVRVPAGECVLIYTLQDLHSSELPSITSSTIELKFSDTTISTSPISLYKELKEIKTPDPLFDRYGFSTVPFFKSFIPEKYNQFFFAIEIYNTLKVLAPQKTFFARTYIRNANTKYVYNETIQMSKILTKNFTYYINKIDITNLPTGEYNLMFELFSEDSTTLYYVTSKYFQRENPKATPPIQNYDNLSFIGSFVEKMNILKDMKERVACLYPIATMAEREFISSNIKIASLDQLRKFFYGFWINHAPLNPELEWKKYEAKVEFVNKEYGSTLMKGYLTDRGRVYLQYGPPNSIVEQPYDSHSYPYEMWQYFTIKEQSDVKFIFYNQNLASNIYELLHSDATGELKDPFWKVKLSTRNTPIFNTDERDIEDYWGSSADEDYKYFK